jgi:hypothetical protein
MGTLLFALTHHSGQPYLPRESIMNESNDLQGVHSAIWSFMHPNRETQDPEKCGGLWKWNGIPWYGATLTA